MTTARKTVDRALGIGRGPDAFAAKLAFRDCRVWFFVQALGRNQVSSIRRGGLVSGRGIPEFGHFTADGEAAYVELDPHGKPIRTIVVNGSFARLMP